MILLLENKILGVISSVSVDRYVKSDDNKKLLHIDAFNLYGWAVSESLPFHKIEKWYGQPDVYMKKNRRDIKYFRCFRY